ncbi:MAG: acylhydrolase, partial [Robiginitalea sp.]
TYARTQNLVYLDYFSALANDKMGLDKDLAEDGVHPTRKGYQIMGPLAEAAILKAMERRR